MNKIVRKEDVATGVVDTFDAGVVDRRNNKRTVNVVVGVIVAPVLCCLADVGVGVADVEVALRCVAAVYNVDNKVPFALTTFLFPNPSVNKDFTLQPTAAAALTAICSRLSESNRNIPGLIAQWTMRIFSDNNSNLVIGERCVVAGQAPHCHGAWLCCQA